MDPLRLLRPHRRWRAAEAAVCDPGTADGPPAVPALRVPLTEPLVGFLVRAVLGPGPLHAGRPASQPVPHGQATTAAELTCRVFRPAEAGPFPFPPLVPREMPPVLGLGLQGRAQSTLGCALPLLFLREPGHVFHLPLHRVPAARVRGRHPDCSSTWPVPGVLAESCPTWGSSGLMPWAKSRCGHHRWGAMWGHPRSGRDRAVVVGVPPGGGWRAGGRARVTRTVGWRRSRRII